MEVLRVGVVALVIFLTRNLGDVIVQVDFVFLLFLSYRVQVFLLVKIVNFGHWQVHCSEGLRVVFGYSHYFPFFAATVRHFLRPEHHAVSVVQLVVF